MRSSLRIARLSSTGTVTKPMESVPFQIVATDSSLEPTPTQLQQDRYRPTDLAAGPLRGRTLSGTRQRRKLTAGFFRGEQSFDARRAIDHRGPVLEQTAGVGAGTVGRVQRLAPEAQVDRELRAVMRRVREASRHDPHARALRVEECGGPLEPLFGFA